MKASPPSGQTSSSPAGGSCAGKGSLLQAVFRPPLSFIRVGLGAGALAHQERSVYSLLCVVTEDSLALSVCIQPVNRQEISLNVWLR